MSAEVPAEDDETGRLRRLIRARFGGRVRGFRVLARGDGIVLRGEVGSFHLKQMVQETVVGATAFRVVANEIAVHWRPWPWGWSGRSGG